MAINLIIVGGGRIGVYLASLMLSGGHKVKIIEQRREQMIRLEKELPREILVLGSGTDPNVLEAAGIYQANVVAAVTGEDETNLVVTNLARFEFNIPRTVAIVNNPKNAWMFTAEMGVDCPLNPADILGHMLAEEMSLGDMVTLFKLRKGLFSVVEEKVHPESDVVGKPVRELVLPDKCVFTAIIRKGELIPVHGDTILQPADEVLALVHASQLDNLARMLDKK